MAGQEIMGETPKASMTVASQAPSERVFQPQLRQIVEVIDLMGTVASRVRENPPSNLPAGAATGGAAAQTAVSARDEAIAKIPEPAIMQQKLVKQLELEISRFDRQAKKLSRSKARGSAFLLADLYKKIRSLTSLVSSILEASTDIIKRFYISAFIDHQPLSVTGDALAQAEA